MRSFIEMRAVASSPSNKGKGRQKRTYRKEDEKKKKKKKKKKKMERIDSPFDVELNA